MMNLTRIVLILSLSFNAMFVVGYFATGTSAEPSAEPEAAAQLVAKELGLDERQREAFVELRKEAEESTQELRQAASIAEEALLKAACEPKPDPERVGTLEADLSEIRKAHQSVSYGHFRRFMGLLTPEQRDAVHEKFRARGRWHEGRRQRVLREFDTDSDGRLDEQERRKAMQTIHERVRQTPGKKPQWRQGGTPPPPHMRPGDRMRDRRRRPFPKGPNAKPSTPRPGSGQAREPEQNRKEVK